MLYTYNKTKLSFERISFKNLLYILLITFTASAIFMKIALNNAHDKAFIEASSIPVEEGFYTVETEADTFSKEALVKELKRLNVRFPEIILAQSILETGHFSSRIFVENNNLFGMKEARARSTTAAGTQLGHAFYDNWKQSVMDYALFQNAYMNRLRKEKSYLKYLEKNYAEAENYDVRLLQIIEKEKLAELFLD